MGDIHQYTIMVFKQLPMPAQPCYTS